MNDVLLVSDGFFHPPILARRAVRETLETSAGARFTQVGHLNALVGLDVERYRAMVLYYHHKRANPEAFSILAEFVQGGGGILAVHSATASFKDQAGGEGARYFTILGGRFTGHGPVAPFLIRPADEADAVLQHIGPFEVKDELYVHDLQSDITVQFEAAHEGAMQPVVWTRREGEGRVCYVGPGHRAQTMQQLQMGEILRRGLLWVMQQ